MDGSHEAPEIPDQSSEAVETQTPAVESQQQEPAFFDPNGLSEDLLPAYKQMQSAFTKKTQEIAAERKFFESFRNPETRGEALQYLAQEAGDEKAILEALGYSIDSEDEDNQDFTFDQNDEELDPLAEIRQELEALKAERAQEQAQFTEQQQLARLETSVEEQFSTLSEAGHQLSDQDKQALVALAVSNFPPGPDGAPQIHKAHEFLEGLFEHRQKAWIQSKQAARPSSGEPGVQKFDIRDRDERIKRMAAIMEAQSDQAA